MIRSRLLSAVGVVFVAAGVAACGSSSTSGGGGTSSPSTGGGTAAQTIHVNPDPTNGGKYDPNPATAKVGDTLKWTFDDSSTAHTVTADDNSFDSGTQNQGATFTHTFTKAGTYPYHCNLHANMKGTITVS